MIKTILETTWATLAWVFILIYFTGELLASSDNDLDQGAAFSHCDSMSGAAAAAANTVGFCGVGSTAKACNNVIQSPDNHYGCQFLTNGCGSFGCEQNGFQPFNTHKYPEALTCDTRADDTVLGLVSGAIGIERAHTDVILACVVVE